MKLKFVPLFLLFALSDASCDYQTQDFSSIKNSAATSIADLSSAVQVADTYFQSDMEGIILTPRTDKKGYNIGGTWDAIKTVPGVYRIYCNDIGIVPTYAFQEVRLDPTGTGRKVLYAQTITDDPVEAGTTRAQTTINFTAGTNYNIYHTSHRMYIHPDFDFLKTYTLKKIDWSIIFEIWNEDGVSKGLFPDGDIAGSCRWSLSIENAGTNKPWFWKIRGDYMQPNALKNKGFWIYTNTTTPIPLGKWFTLDLYMKRGEGTNGKMIIKITPDGGVTTTLFDISNSTVYTGYPQLNVYAWQPFKFYFNPIYQKYMSDNKKTLGVYYNDYKWYKN